MPEVHDANMNVRAKLSPWFFFEFYLLRRQYLYDLVVRSDACSGVTFFLLYKEDRWNASYCACSVWVINKKQGYDQQMAHVMNKTTLVHVSGVVFGHLQGLSLLKNTYSVFVPVHRVPSWCKRIQRQCRIYHSVSFEENFTAAWRFVEEDFRNCLII